MSERTIKCQLDDCNRMASTNCFCCKKNVCTRHFTEHIAALKAQIDPLANETNEMVEKIQSLTVDKITAQAFAELRQWRDDMHQLIDDIYSTQTKQMEDLIARNKDKFVEHKKQQLESVMNVQDEMKQLAEDGDVTFQQLQRIKTQLATVENNLAGFTKKFLSVDVRVLADGLVTVSSDWNKSTPPPSENFGSSSSKSETKQNTFSFGGQASPASPFNAFGSGFQTNPTTASSVPPFTTLGTVTTSESNSSGTVPLFTSACSSSTKPTYTQSSFTFPAQSTTTSTSSAFGSGFTFPAQSATTSTSSAFGSGFIFPAQSTTTSTSSAFGSGFQTNSTTAPSVPPFTTFGTVTTSATNSSNSTPFFTSTGFHSSASPFTFYNNQHK